MTKNSNKNRVFRFNRRIRKKTDYNLRLRLLKSKLTRIVVRRSNGNMLVQFVDYDEKGDKVQVSARSADLKNYKFQLNTGNIVAAYLTGYLAGKRALKAGIKEECIVDLGLQKVQYGTRIFAAIKGVKDAGVEVRVSDVVFPAQERLEGAHLKEKDAQKKIEATKSAIDTTK